MTVWVLELIILLLVGLLLIWLGWRIWKKEQITLIHDYHYSKVSKENQKAYTEKMGKALIIMGLGIVLTGVIDIATKSFYGWIIFAISFLWGSILIFITQNKYNGGLF